MMALFVGKCMEFAKIDVFSGEQVYEFLFTFKETEPVNGRFEEMGLDT